MPTVTYTLNIVDISPVGGNIWRLEFNPNDTLLEANIISNPITYLSASSPVILNPFLNNLAGFNNSDYNAIINNATGERLSEWYQQVDYATAQTIPVNFEAIISGTAYPAAIQDSNYTSYQYSGIRYWGSKNTTDNVNIASISQSLVVQNYQNDNIGATTLGYPSTENLTNIGLFYQWAGGTDPEVPGKTNFQIKFMFDASGNVFLPDVSSSYYNDLLNAFPQNSQVNVIPYNEPGTTQTYNSVQASIQGIQTVFWPGVYFNSYLTTQSGSTNNNNFVSSSIRLENLTQSDIDDIIISSYWFTSSYGDTSILKSAGTIGIYANNAYENTVNTTNAVYNASSIYYQLPSSESNPNRAGFDTNRTPLMFSPYKYSDGFTPPFNTFEGSFSQFPDLVRIGRNSDLYDYYTITQATSSYGVNEIHIQLSDNVNSGAIINGFINRITFLRLVPSPEKIYLNINKASGDSGPGFILPFNPTPQLINNLPDIIKDLSNRNLI